MEKFVDRLFAEVDQKWSKTKIRSLIDQGYARLNGKIHRIATTPCGGKDRVELLFEEKAKDEPKTAKKQMVVVFEDPYVRIYDKPIGVESDVRRYPRLVHRIDKETSGLLIEAKSDEALVAFEQLFKEKKIEKSYRAIVFGNFQKGVEIDLPIDRQGRVAGFERFCVSQKGKKAQTSIQPLVHSKHYTLLACSPKTGRTHQIRVHLQAVGYPIVGDLLYSQSNTRFERMYLHAMTLAFKHPFTAQLVKVQAQIPPSFDLLLTTD